MKANRPSMTLASILALAAWSCGQQPAPDQASEAVTAHEGAPAEVEHADADVAPGSYEDWCGEHEVPESVCTRCNPKLIAAFKATGDWCEEHGLPESQCRACKPDLVITRPPKTTSGGQARAATAEDPTTTTGQDPQATTGDP